MPKPVGQLRQGSVSKKFMFRKDLLVWDGKTQTNYTNQRAKLTGDHWMLLMPNASNMGEIFNWLMGETVSLSMLGVFDTNG